MNGDAAQAFEVDGTTLTLPPGVYTVTELAAAGYTTTSANCTNVVIVSDQTATCTITNDDQPGRLIVNKIVINDNLGVEAVTAFSIQVNGGVVIAFGANGSIEFFLPPGVYTVTELFFPGYTTSFANCTSLAIAGGQTVTCTITNNDIGPTFEEQPEPEPEPIPAPTTTTTTIAADKDDVLPRTGANSATPALLALFSMAIGLALSLRRRRPAVP